MPNFSALTGGVRPEVTVTTATIGGVTTADPTLITSVPNTVAAKDGNNAKIRVIIDGSLTNGATGFVIATSHSSIRGLIIDGFGVGVSIPSPDNVGDLVQGNFIGKYFLFPVDRHDGGAAAGAERGDLHGDRKLTPGRAPGIDQCDDRRRRRLRTTTSSPATGSRACRSCRAQREPGPRQSDRHRRSVARRTCSPFAPNGAEGVLIASSSNTVGGDTAGAGNLISANIGDGVHITGLAATRNRVEGNYIGIGPGGGFLFGAGNPGNLGNGVLIENASDNRIGGPNKVQGNVISANKGAGVKITGPSATGQRPCRTIPSA